MLCFVSWNNPYLAQLKRVLSHGKCITEKSALNFDECYIILKNAMLIFPTMMHVSILTSVPFQQCDRSFALFNNSGTPLKFTLKSYKTVHLYSV